MNSAASSSKNLTKTPRVLVFLFLATGLVGFLDTVYLTARHFLGIEINCNLIQGCEQVLNSSYSAVGPVPLALIGAIHYLAIIAATVFYLDTGSRRALQLALALAGVGLLVTGVLLYLQIFVIGALCFYCLISAASSTTLAGLAVKLRKSV